MKLKLRLRRISNIIFIFILFSCTKNGKQEISTEELIIESGQYFENRKDSLITKNYYSDSALKSTQRIINTFRYVESITYHKDLYEEFYTESKSGDTVFIERPLQKSYKILNNRDSVLFKLDYDSIGNIESVKGEPIYIFQNLKYEDEIHFNFFTVEPNWVDVNINYKLYNVPNGKFIKQDNFVVDGIFFKIDFADLIDGKYILDLQIELKNVQNETIFSDSLKIDFEYNRLVRSKIET
ncbi:hypothetical protein C9994_12840 [Marivirga lumbricoides]|uniref:Lipoprotein n=1 Tax=Marivirga lumbricoides TaxID=1046115 RepID=A0A2T4DIH7_9BACT|nr:hypothetical protein C9994_12840 [Marivirga lumbricoides]